MSRFIGRQRELKQLQRLRQQNRACLLTVKGRRRIGKSRLLSEFGKSFEHTYVFMGLAPEEGISSKDQRLEFSAKLQEYFSVTGLKADDWRDLFWHLAHHTQQGDILIVFDEISWMAMDDATFLPKLKNAWEQYFSKNDQLVFAICGSISSWIEKKILSSTGFLGRTSLDLTLKEIPLRDCIKFWQDGGSNASPQELLTMLAVIGGIPRYLEEVNPRQSAEWNIKQLCFTEGGILYREFEKLFTDLFTTRKARYKEIISKIVDGKQEPNRIRQAIGLSRSGNFYEYLDDLEQAGFVYRDYNWSIRAGQFAKLNQVRICDNYSRFYLKYIEPNLMKIKLGNFNGITLASLPAWNTIMGLQIENLILNNRALIKEAIDIDLNEIVCDNPYFQRPTKSQKGCQIDYMIQTRFNQLYIFEIKFSRKPIGVSVIDEVQEKINQLKLPRNFSYRPILIHCNDVSEQVEDAQYFSHIIDFTTFLNKR